MAPDGEPSQRARSGRSGDYRSARIGAASALVFVLVVLLIADVLVDTYELQPLIVAMLLGAIGGLLGVELLNALRGIVR